MRIVFIEKLNPVTKSLAQYKSKACTLDYLTDNQILEGFRRFLSVNSYPTEEKAFLKYKSNVNKNERINPATSSFEVDNVSLYTKLYQEYLNAKRSHDDLCKQCMKAAENNVPYDEDELNDSFNTLWEAKRNFISAFPNTYYYIANIN